RGRMFTPDETASAAPVVILSETAARRLLPDRDPVGQSIELDHGHFTKLPRHNSARVIGIAHDIVNGVNGNDPDRLCVYFPSNANTRGAALLLRVHGDVESLRRKIDRDMAASNPGAVEAIHKLQEFVVGRIYPFRVAYWVSAAIACIALLLTFSGVYGVLSYL